MRFPPHSSPFLIATREIPPVTRHIGSAQAASVSERFARFFDCRKGRMLTHLHLAGSRWKERILPTRRLRILFSPMPDWEQSIREAFTPFGHEIEFAEFSRESIRGRDLVVPLTLEDVLMLDGMRDLLGGNPIPIPSPESVAICDDKRLFEETLAVRGFAEFLPGPRLNREFPYVLKRKIDAWGRHCAVVHGVDEEEGLRHHLDDPDYLHQRFISGREEFTTHIVFREGRILAALNLRYRFADETPIKGRSHPLTIHPCKLSHGALFREILLSIGFEGLCCFNYKLEQGKPLILEINPRFGGSLGTFFPGFVRDLVR